MNNIFDFLQANKPELLVVADDKEAYSASDCANYLGYKPFVLSDFRANVGDDLNSFSGELKNIIKVLEEYYEYKKQNKILISPLRTISFALPKQTCFDKLVLNFGDRVDLDNLKNQLFNWGYVFVDIVSTNGEVSIRGDIIDICPLESEFGYRISLFDDEIESIRQFDIETQKSQKDELETIFVTPAFLAIDEDKLQTINEKIESSQSDAFIKDIHSLGFWYLDDLAEYKTELLQSAITQKALNEIDEAYIVDEKRIQKEKLLSITPILSSKKYTLINPANINEFLNFHKEKKITVISSSEAKIRANELPLKNDEKFKNYFIRYGTEIINLLSDDEVIISLNKEIKKRKKKRVKIIIDELQSGDFVVHETHGIGRFKHIEPISVMGAKRDFVVIEYQGGDKLLLPVENLDLIDRYVASSGDVAILDKLGKGSFAKLKSKVKEKLFAIANEIIKLAAQRELIEGIKINTNKEEIKILQNDAGFIYTKDQVKAVNELLKDLNSGKVMDRLLSGDVGFGKTEVAINGILATPDLAL